MASTVLASRNQTSYNNHHHHRSLMGEIPNYTNSNRNLNPNPNQKPKSSNKRKHHFSTNGGGGGRVQNHDIIVSQGAASDDAYSYNQRLPPNEAINCFNQLVTYNVAACSRNEINELRKKLVSDLARIRNLNDRIQGGEFNVNVTNPNGKFKKLSGNKRMAGTTSFGSGNNKQLIRQQGLVGNLNNNNNINNNNNNNNGEGDDGLMKMCRQVLTKLLKHKLSWVFKVPVDAVKLGLHDYHQIIKRPMDLGTVKSNISKGLYGNPLDFAADVRLVFENAMLYNPRTDEVHRMADSLLRHFEDLFRPIQEKLSVNNNHHLNEFSAVDELDGSSWDDIPTPKKAKTSGGGGGFTPVSAPPPPAVSNKQNNHSTASNAIIPPPVVQPVQSMQSIQSLQSPVRTPSPMQPAEPVKPSSTTTRAYAKLPKPKAKDPNKREMNMEEKQRLGLGLQSLPPEKMPQLLQIIKKRNDRLSQDGDEIELDIEALDTETLWELDRFVTNWKKADSKAKRQALLVNSASAAAGPSVSADIDDVPMVEKTDGGGMKKNKREAGEEDVDIGDEMPESSFPHVEIEKDDGGGVGHHIQAPIHGNDNAGGNASSSSSGSSSSSSGDSSSSSDSDSGSSSGSDSGADEAQS